ncbi:WYL domain-containing protein [Pannonibacter tanglangensis]|uniref:WYL domain-containing protein n=1 Tax=Pannonibacter tanglangensis TaxID=2750084 RepID=A0ABW9ZIU4_9HYPH|nr:WYL domain-containing protein [Pannonibacter sp. XCT-34]NBN64793.1 WYL domain-containing protein [Pannonibacter sp. XCT-34]
MHDNRRGILFGWIEACLRYGGEFGASDKMIYRQIFGVSEGTVSRHQVEFAAAFEEECGKVLQRDGNGRLVSGKLVLRMDANLPDQPVFPRMPTLQRWLQEALGSARYLEPEPLRQDPASWIVRTIVQAIRAKVPLRITYHSRKGVSERLTSVYALVHVVGRTHMRAFDHSKNQPRDFVLSRITDAYLSPGSVTYVGFEKDSEWGQMQTVVVSEKSNLVGNNDSDGVRLDYKLDETGRRKIKLNKTIIRYIIDEIDPGFESPVKIDKIYIK